MRAPRVRQGEGRLTRKSPAYRRRGCAFHGADDGVRTRDPDLGKVVLYQLSHVRVARKYNNGTHSFAQALIFDFLSARKHGRCGQRGGNAATRAMREIARKPLSQALGDRPGKQSGRRRFRAPPFHAKGEKTRPHVEPGVGEPMQALGAHPLVLDAKRLLSPHGEHGRSPQTDKLPHCSPTA